MDVIDATRRTERGRAKMKQLRRAGKVPAVLYGHQQESISLTLDERQVDAVLRHGSHIVQLQGEINQGALVKEVQWDALGTQVLHLDLTRIDAQEKVEVALPIVLRGEAVGTHHGGVVQLVLHELEISCPADKLPDRLEVKINELDVNQSISAADVHLPEGAELVTDPEEVVAQCVPAEAFEVVEEEPAEPTAAEPEVIKRREEEEEESEEG